MVKGLDRMVKGTEMRNQARIRRVAILAEAKNPPNRTPLSSCCRGVEFPAKVSLVRGRDRRNSDPDCHASRACRTLAMALARPTCQTGGMSFADLRREL